MMTEDDLEWARQFDKFLNVAAAATVAAVVLYLAFTVF